MNIYIERLWSQYKREDRQLMERMRENLKDKTSHIPIAIMDPDGNPIPCDLATCIIWQIMYPHAYIVLKSIIADIEISTIFSVIGLNRSLKDEMVHFETMVTGGKDNGKILRSATIQEARATHEDLCCRYGVIPYEDKK